MLMVVKNNINFFKESMKTNIKSILVYKTSFLVQSFFMMINNSFFIIFWVKIFQAVDEVKEFSFNDVLLLGAISSIAYGVTYFFFYGVTYINRYIIDCSMDSYFLQPKCILLNVLLSKSDFSAFGDFFFGMLIVIIIYNKSLDMIIHLIIFGIFGSIYFLSTEIILRSVCVWLGDTEILSDRYIHVLLTQFSTYPQNIFPKTVKVMLYTIIPAGFLSYLPIDLIHEFDVKKIIIYVISGLVYLIVSIKVFYSAIKHYNSGNNMNLRTF